MKYIISDNNNNFIGLDSNGKYILTMGKFDAVLFDSKTKASKELNKIRNNVLKRCKGAKIVEVDNNINKIHNNDLNESNFPILKENFEHIARDYKEMADEIYEVRNYLPKAILKIDNDIEKLLCDDLYSLNKNERYELYNLLIKRRDIKRQLESINYIIKMGISVERTRYLCNSINKIYKDENYTPKILKDIFNKLYDEFEGE